MNQDQEFQQRLWQAKDKLLSLTSSLEMCRKIGDWYVDAQDRAKELLEQVAEAGYEYWLLKKQQSENKKE